FAWACGCWLARSRIISRFRRDFWSRCCCQQHSSAQSPRRQLSTSFLYGSEKLELQLQQFVNKMSTFAIETIGEHNSKAEAMLNQFFYQQHSQLGFGLVFIG